MEKCKYLAMNADKVGFDVIEECPRFLCKEEQCILLDSLGCALSEFGDVLQKFVTEYQLNLVPMDDFFDRHYKALFLAYYHARRDIEHCGKVTYTRFMGKDY